jgi:hypothetical protein
MMNRIEMSSVPVHGNHVIVQSMAAVDIEVVENSLFGGGRLAIIGPYESLVFEATTNGYHTGRSTAVLVGSGGTATTTLGNTGWLVGDYITNSSNFVDAAADTSVTVLSLAATDMGSFAGSFAGSTAAEFMTTEHGSDMAEVMTSMSACAIEMFNTVISCFEKQVDLIIDAMTDVGVGASS